jgi:hypothetical protein
MCTGKASLHLYTLKARNRPRRKPGGSLDLTSCLPQVFLPTQPSTKHTGEAGVAQSTRYLLFALPQASPRSCDSIPHPTSCDPHVISVDSDGPPPLPQARPCELGLRRRRCMPRMSVLDHSPPSCDEMTVNRALTWVAPFCIVPVPIGQPIRRSRSRCGPHGGREAPVTYRFCRIFPVLLV